MAAFPMLHQGGMGPPRQLLAPYKCQRSNNRFGWSYFGCLCPVAFNILILFLGAIIFKFLRTYNHSSRGFYIFFYQNNIKKNKN